MPALKVDLLEFLFSAAISLLFCGADRRQRRRIRGAMTGYLRSNECSKHASSAAGPGYTSAHPAFLNSSSVKPPQSTPTVRTSALPAASASYGVSVSPIATASAPSIFSFLRTILKMSGAGFDSSTSSEEVVRSTRSTMRAMSRYLSTSSFLAEEALRSEVQPRARVAAGSGPPRRDALPVFRHGLVGRRRTERRE
jgi:hypothetical protein